MKKSKPAVEIRCPNSDGVIDEIVAKNCAVHVEQLSDSEWSLYIETEDQGYWFELRAKNPRAHVLAIHVDTEHRGKLKRAAK